MNYYLNWQDTQYSDFMIRILSVLEPRLFDAGEVICEAGEEVDE